MYVMIIDKGGMDTNARLDRVAQFRKFERSTSKVCCMNGGDLDLNKYMTGFGIIIKHYKGLGFVTNPLNGEKSQTYLKYIDWTYEGEFSGGFDKHTGFGRLGFNNKKGELAVGYWSGFKNLRGKGVVHTDKLIYAGKWTNEDFN